MAKTLELSFNAELGSAKISIRDPKEPIDPSEVKTAMDQIVAANAFETTKGDIVSVESARVIERNVEPLELV